MGSGTDVTKNAADMVIADDDFATIARAAEEGRNVFYNVKKTISFFLSTNLAEVLSVLVVTLFLWQYEFLTSTQLLWINLITDSLPVLALGVERTEGAMDGPPVNAGDIFGKRSLFTMAFFGVVQTVLAVSTFVLSLSLWGNGVASTVAFFTLSLLELFYAFNVRKERAPLKVKGLFENKTLLFTATVGVAVNVLLVLIPPLCKAFSLTPLNGMQWGLVFAVSLSIIPIGELFKWIVRFKAKLSKRKKRIPARGNAQ
jgi:Ca2+-transporting ATPase